MKGLSHLHGPYCSSSLKNHHRPGPELTVPPAATLLPSPLSWRSLKASLRTEGLMSAFASWWVQGSGRAARGSFLEGLCRPRLSGLPGAIRECGLQTQRYIPPQSPHPVAKHLSSEARLVPIEHAFQT